MKRVSHPALLRRWHRLTPSPMPMMAAPSRVPISRFVPTRMLPLREQLIAWIREQARLRGPS